MDLNQSARSTSLDTGSVFGLQVLMNTITSMVDNGAKISSPECEMWTLYFSECEMLAFTTCFTVQKSDMVVIVEFFCCLNTFTLFWYDFGLNVP